MHIHKGLSEPAIGKKNSGCATEIAGEHDMISSGVNKQKGKQELISFSYLLVNLGEKQFELNQVVCLSWELMLYPYYLGTISNR